MLKKLTRNNRKLLSETPKRLNGIGYILEDSIRGVPLSNQALHIGFTFLDDIEIRANNLPNAYGHNRLEEHREIGRYSEIMSDCAFNDFTEIGAEIDIG